jgi:hypothetical protein
MRRHRSEKVQRHAVGDQRLPAGAGGPVRLRRPTGRAASAQAAKIAQLQGGNGNITAIPAFIRADFAGATRDVLYGMAIIMAVAALVALRGLRRGVQEDTVRTTEGFSKLPGEAPGAGLDRPGARLERSR